MISNTYLKQLFPLVLSTLLITGCASTTDNMEANPYLVDAEAAVKELRERQAKGTRTERNKVEIIDSFYADRSARSREDGDWLKEVPFTMQVGDQGDLSLRQIMQAFSRSGVNITSSFDINGYYYTGTSIVDTDAKSALRVILGNMGLDYKVDEESKVVTISSMPRESYYLSLNNRSSSYSSGSSGGLSSSEEGGSGDDEQELTELGITANNDFWDSLATELDSRCKVLVPTYGDPVFPTQQSGVNYGSSDDALVGSLQGAGTGLVVRGEREDITEEPVCLTSLNRNTGTVTVHGPRWVQDDMGEYFKRLNKTLNTRITLDAKIILFATTAEESAGIDLSAFAGSLQDTGLAITNNVLGGITLTASGGMANISETASVASSFAGVRIDGAQAFLGWLENKGSVSIENEPIITTVSGVPTTFKRTSPVVYFRYSQETTTNEGGSASVSINSEEVTRTIGSILNVNPTFDMDRNVVRTQIAVDQRYLTGWAEDTSYLAAGNNIQAIPVRVPLIESIVLNGELLLRDGETIIVGGQKFTTADSQESGITNLRDNSFFGGLFGRANAKNEVLTYYTILTVQVDETPNEQAVRL